MRRPDLVAILTMLISCRERCEIYAELIAGIIGSRGFIFWIPTRSRSFSVAKIRLGFGFVSEHFRNVSCAHFGSNREARRFYENSRREFSFVVSRSKRYRTAPLARKYSQGGESFYRFSISFSANQANARARKC